MYLLIETFYHYFIEIYRKGKVFFLNLQVYLKNFSIIHVPASLTHYTTSVSNKIVIYSFYFIPYYIGNKYFTHE